MKILGGLGGFHRYIEQLPYKMFTFRKSLRVTLTNNLAIIYSVTYSKNSEFKAS